MSEENMDSTNNRQQDEEHPVYKDLLDIAESNNISTDGQKAISKAIAGHGWHWHQIPKEHAVEVLTEIQTNGLDEVQRWGLAGKKTEPKISAEERTEIIYVDDESYEITPQKRQAYEFHDQEMKMGWLKASFHLAITLETELYKVGGYNTKEEYARYHLGESPRNMRRKAKNGRRILSMLPDRTSMSDLQAGEYNGLLENISEIGPTKLNEIIKFDDDEFDLKELAETGEATLPSGKTISIEDIRMQTVKEVSQEMQEERKKLQGRIANLEEDKKKYKEERDGYKKDLEDNKSRIERSKELEEKYGKQAARMEEIDYLLDKTEDGLQEIEHSFGKVEVEFSDPDALRERVMTLLRRMTMIQEAALTRYGWLEDMDGLSLFPAHKLNEMTNGKGEPADADSIE